MGGVVILASWKDHFIRVGENLLQHPSNNISIVIGLGENYEKNDLSILFITRMIKFSNTAKQ